LVIEKAREFGADLAGIASVEQLKRSPSHRLLARFGTKIDGEYAYGEEHDRRHVDWPSEARSAVVIAVSHPRGEPELDWSCPTGQTPGNRRLVQAGQRLSEWIERDLDVRARPMLYHVEEGGVYVKDAAVLAGLGCIGRNNIVVNPEYGPRIRFRVVLVDAEMTPTGPIPFDPCRACDAPCRRACPQSAFERVVLTPEEAGIDALPGRDGSFSRGRCGVQLDQDMEESGVEGYDSFGSDIEAANPALDCDAEDERRIKWCRRCELACPVGE
jgi:epoxyqueuosine reductase